MAGRHRLEPPPRVRVRRGRMIVAGVAAAVTAVTLLGGMGALPFRGDGPGAGPAASEAASTPSATPAPTPSPTPSPAQGPSAATSSTGVGSTGAATAATSVSRKAAVPAASGKGRRIVFSIPQQRVWLVDGKGRTVSTYLVSGSVLDNLKPGSYAVYSRSRWANGIQDSGVMQYFVRFTRGENAAIGFHSIPTKNGVPLQTVRQLGTPQSHGCIRQRLQDAIRLWDFAPVGTKVVVV